jgi:hypothetical protein
LIFQQCCNPWKGTGNQGIKKIQIFFEKSFVNSKPRLIFDIQTGRNVKGRNIKMTLEQSQILIEQLGGRKFIAMTGTKGFLRGEVSETNPKPWLRMDLSKNKSGATRLKITLEANDTYTMYFYKMTLGQSTNWEAKISKEQTFEGVYEDMLQDIFTEITGLYTKL